MIGGFSLFAAALGIVDFTSRIGADFLKSVYLRDSRHSENRIYFGLVWGLVACGCAVLLLGMRQPLVLLVISSVTGGLIMRIYSILLFVLNRRELPAAIRITRIRIAALVWATLLFGFLAVLTFNQQIRVLLS